MKKIIILILLFCSIANAATYYVDPVDGDSGNDGSVGTPFDAVSTALGVLSAGDTVYLMGGNHGYISITGLNGSSGNEITFMPYESENAYVSKLLLTNCSYITWEVDAYSEQLTMSQSYKKGIDLANCDNITIQNAKVYAIDKSYHWREKAINIGGECTNTTIQDCNVYYYYQGIGAGGENTLVKDCTIHDGGGAAIAAGETTPTTVDNKQLTIDGCVIYDMDDNMQDYNPSIADYHGSGLEMRKNNVTIKNCYIHNYGSTASIRFYQTVYDGVIEYKTDSTNVTGTFEEGETVTLSNSKTGTVSWVWTGSTETAIIMFMDDNDIDSYNTEGLTITGDTSLAEATGTYTNGYRPYGGYNDILIENTVVSKPQNGGISLFDINDVTIKNCTVTAGKYSDPAGTIHDRYQSNFNLTGDPPLKQYGFAYCSDGSGLKLYNNIFAGYVYYANGQADEFNNITDANNYAWSIRASSSWDFLSQWPSGTGIVAVTGDPVSTGGSNEDYFLAGHYDYFGDGNDGNFFVGNLENDYEDIASLHITSSSPVVGQGSSTYATTLDYDGNVRDGSPDIGAFEYVLETVSPPTGLGLNLDSTNPESVIDLYWQDNATNEDAYKVYWSTDNTNWTVISIAADSTSYSHTGRSSDTLYYYKVAASLSGVNSSFSNTASITTNDVVPDDPCDLTATAVSSSQIDLEWVDDSDNETGFKIERSLTTSTGFSQIATTAADVNTYSDTGRSASTEYFYRVRAYNAIGNSNYTAEASDTTDAATSPPATPATGLTEYLAPKYLGDYEHGKVVVDKWRSNVTDGNLAVFKGNLTTATKGLSGSADVNGITDIRGFAGISGVNAYSIDTSGFEAGYDYSVILTDAVYDSNDVDLILSTFSIENRANTGLTSSQVQTLVDAVLSDTETKVDSVYNTVKSGGSGDLSAIKETIEKTKNLTGQLR